MNPDLAVERQNPPFNFRSLTSFLYGGEENLAKRKYFSDFVNNVEEFKDPTHVTFMDREQRIANSQRKTVAMLEMEKSGKIKLNDSDDMNLFRHYVVGRETSPISLHVVMFLPALQGQCTDEQKKKWLPLALSHKIIGTYAQTELGHGTNLKKLETTATYDADRQEFVINSPTLTSTKWWPGNMGKTANHALVIAQLYTKGVKYGVHPFMVQLRDFDTHDPLPGIIVGDIGPKFGINGNDNGFLRLDHVRVPRENMLMKFARVEPDGTYIPPKHEKLAYGAMLHVRSSMITETAQCLQIATTIATRYSCVRRQGEKFPGGGEVKLLDYQTQQYRIFPEIAKSYAFYFAGYYLRKIYEKISAQVSQGDVALLHELHIVSSGLKGYITFESTKGVEVCRLSCGGHGYSQASGLPELYAWICSSCTYEGDNIVLFLQVARHLVKTVRQKTNERLSAYLWKKISTKSNMNKELKMTDLLDIYEHSARKKIYETVKYLDELESQGLSSEEAWDKCAVELTKCAKAHVRVFIVKNFMDAVETAKDPDVKKLLHTLCQLYALYGIHMKHGSFAQDGYVSAQQITNIRRRLNEILAEIRPIAVQLVDAFDFSDRELGSILGRYDGDVYPNLFKWARESPLNKKDVLDSHYKYTTPMQKSKI